MDLKENAIHKLKHLSYVVQGELKRQNACLDLMEEIGAELGYQVDRETGKVKKAASENTR